MGLCCPSSVSPSFWWKYALLLQEALVSETFNNLIFGNAVLIFSIIIIQMDHDNLWEENKGTHGLINSSARSMAFVRVGALIPWWPKPLCVTWCSPLWDLDVVFCPACLNYLLYFAPLQNNRRIWKVPTFAVVLHCTLPGISEALTTDLCLWSTALSQPFLPDIRASDWAMGNTQDQSGLKCLAQMRNSKCCFAELEGPLWSSRFNFNLTRKMAEINRFIQNTLGNRFFESVINFI